MPDCNIGKKVGTVKRGIYKHKYVQSFDWQPASVAEGVLYEAAQPPSDQEKGCCT